MNFSKKDNPIFTQYRGYVLITNNLATDIWNGKSFIETVAGVGSLKRAQTTVDSYFSAR